MSATDSRIFFGLVCTFAIALFSAPARAADLSDAEAKRFFNDHGCNACHAVDEARIGPPFRAVAIRYAANAEALATLTQKVRFGGAGSWGTVPMISYPTLAEEDAQAVTRWILNLKPDAAPARDATR